MTIIHNYTREQFTELLAEHRLLDGGKNIELMNRWLARGDGVALYENVDLGHPNLGHVQCVSFGSPLSQLETDEPPERLPDIGNRIGWRYALKATYKGEAI